MAELIPVLCGPTGSGKSSLAHELARTHPIEIIVADSRQVIRHLDIGTEKPTLVEQQEVRYHLIDLVEPGEQYTAFRFVQDAEHAIADIIARNKIPLVVGGTGLYIRALIRGIAELQSDQEIRDALQKEIDAGNAEKLYAELMQVDPETAKTFHYTNHVRLIRALEIYRLTGRPKSVVEKTGRQRGGKYLYHALCYLPPRAELYERINERSKTQLAKGLLKEVQALIETGRKDAVRKANVICYNELLDYCEGITEYEKTISLIQQHCRQLAKRQYTWFRKEPDFQQVTDFATARRVLGEMVNHWLTRH